MEKSHERFIQVYKTLQSIYASDFFLKFTAALMDLLIPPLLARTELLIQKAMRSLMADKTCFVIAHRLSTIQNADQILAVRDGTVVERGTHEELPGRRAFYYKLYTSQYELAGITGSTRRKVSVK